MMWEYKRLYLGDPMHPYALNQLNAAGKEGWELVQVFQFDGIVKRRVVDVQSKNPPPSSVNMWDK